MRTTPFLLSLVSWLPILPAAVMCYAPMGNQLRHRGRGTYIRIMLLICLLMLALSYLEATFPMGYNTLLPLVFVTTLIAYRISLKAPSCKVLATYFLVFAFMSFLANFANGFDAALHPHSTLANFSLEAAIFQDCITLIFAAATYFPLKKYGGMLVDSFDIQKVWFITLPISGMLIIYNLMIAPRRYETVHLNRAFLFYWVSLTILTLLLLLLCVIFYFIVSGMMDAAEERERNRILEMQESLYLTQQRYIEDTAKTRHDFKHTIGTLDSLVSQGDLKAVRAYLDEYLAAQPQKESEFFCKNTAVNALLNYYLQMAKGDGTPLELEVALPEALPVSDIDLCSILGNILENAILACRNLPREHRFIDLVLRADPGAPVYMVATNSFDGQLRISGGHYLSTRRQGQGLGLKSISQTAAAYGGSARFTHSPGAGPDSPAEFCTDVVLNP